MFLFQRINRLYVFIGLCFQLSKREPSEAQLLAPSPQIFGFRSANNLLTTAPLKVTIAGKTTL